VRLRAEGPGDYEIGYKKPPVATRFKKGNRANPRGRPRGSKNLASLLERALDMPADADAGDKPSRLTKRDLMVARLVERSAGADLAAIKLLFELLRKAEPRMVTAPADPAGAPPADDPIAEVRAKLLRLARAQGLIPPPDAALPAPADLATDPDDASSGAG
jgi:hypothetical protein